MFPSGLAAQEGTIEKEDEVLSINGQTLHGVTHADATAALRQARCLKQAVVVVCKRADVEEREGGSCRSDGPNPGESQHLTKRFHIEGHRLTSGHVSCVLYCSGGAGSSAEFGAGERSWRSWLYSRGRERLNPWRQTFSHQQDL